MYQEVEANACCDEASEGSDLLLACTSQEIKEAETFTWNEDMMLCIKANRGTIRYFSPNDETKSEIKFEFPTSESESVPAADCCNKANDSKHADEALLLACFT